MVSTLQRVPSARICGHKRTTTSPDRQKGVAASQQSVANLAALRRSSLIQLSKNATPSFPDRRGFVGLFSPNLFLSAIASRDGGCPSPIAHRPFDVKQCSRKILHFIFERAFLPTSPLSSHSTPSAGGQPIAYFLKKSSPTIAAPAVSSHPARPNFHEFGCFRILFF
jgi:hypothetical protein